MHLTADQIAQLAPKMLAHPRRVVLGDWPVNQQGTLFTIAWLCPTCEGYIAPAARTPPSRQPEHCPRCQQVLDWSKQEATP